MGIRGLALLSAFVITPSVAHAAYVFEYTCFIQLKGQRGGEQFIGVADPTTQISRHDALGQIGAQCTSVLQKRILAACEKSSKKNKGSYEASVLFTSGIALRTTGTVEVPTDTCKTLASSGEGTATRK